MTTYRIERIWKSDRIPKGVIKTGLTIEEAKAHCSDPKTSTKLWFDSWTKEQ